MKKTLGSVESFTGGLFASEIVAIPNASSYFKGAIIAYANEIKSLIGVDTSQGVISAKVAKELSVAGREYLNVDVCVSFTGNAGPEAMENKPIGLVYIAINDEIFELNLLGSRNEIRKAAVDFALEKIKYFL